MQDRKNAVYDRELHSQITAAAHLAPLQMPTEAAACARKLYAALRQVDAAHFNLILAEAPPAGVKRQAVNDRLRRAATVYCPAQIQPQEKTHEEIS